MENNVVSTTEPRSQDDNDESVLTINVGGTVFMTKLKTLRTVGVGRLGKLSRDDPSFNRETGEFFFDRDPKFFSHVLQFYRSGELHVTENCCSKTLKSELEFWELGVDTIGDCCWGNFCKAEGQAESTIRLTRHLKSVSEGTPKSSDKDQTCKQRLWIFLENPTSSIAAKIWASISCILLITSITCYALTTLPEAKRSYFRNFGTNKTVWTAEQLEHSDNFLFTVTMIDICCLFFFTVDFFLRVFSAPRKLAFFASFLFYCDLLFLIPGWLLDLVIVSKSQILVEIAVHNNIVLIIIQVLTVTRLFRIFRLAGYFQGIRILFYVLKASISELLLLGVFVSIGVLLYGFLIYSAEVGENESFDSAFRGFWWAIITMSTVGYGDFYPVSTLGYIIAAMCAISGLVIIGLPIPIIASNFDLYYGFRAREPAVVSKGSKPSTCSRRVSSNVAVSSYSTNK